MNHICEPFSKQLVRYISFFDTTEVLRRLANNTLDVIVTRSQEHDTITIADITVPMTHEFGAIPDTTCEYDTWTKTWIFTATRRLPDKTRASLIQIYLTKAFVAYPDCAARICDVAIATLRNTKHIYVMQDIGGIWSTATHTDISSFLTLIRSTDAFQTLCAQIHETGDSKQSGTKRDAEDRDRDIQPSGDDDQQERQLHRKSTIRDDHRRNDTTTHGHRTAYTPHGPRHDHTTKRTPTTRDQQRP